MFNHESSFPWNSGRKKKVVVEAEGDVTNAYAVPADSQRPDYVQKFKDGATASRSVEELREPVEDDEEFEPATGEKKE